MHILAAERVCAVTREGLKVEHRLRNGRLERPRREINAVAPSLKRDPFGFIWVKVAIT